MADANAQLMAESALAHLSMLYQVAVGQTNEKPERTRKRFELLATYVRTGAMSVSPEDSAIAAKIAEVTLAATPQIEAVAQAS
jgi:hypothetical protein